MAYYLYKPHVQGPNNITTPDILIDRLYRTLTTQNSVELLGVGVKQLTSNVELQCSTSKLTITPAYVMIAAGGGVLLGVGAEIYDGTQGTDANFMLVARFAWRLKYLQDHLDKMKFVIKVGPVSEQQIIEEIEFSGFPAPGSLIEQLKPEGTELPRGTMIFATASGIEHQINVPKTYQIKIVDTRMDRELTHRVSLFSSAQDDWDPRPIPRYTVGPTTGDIKHYI